ncbi:FCD domain-containing protein [Kribbella solani]|uniref:FadR/GntR family transcriptional regulator n=1 Tax=Kribbella solani TaxID=236067 RepID=UPI0029A3F2BA|nr:FCD domain-containing protein [Kribbella solani]MDX3006558.1 FCD domain-containing protein [Kribbella solani]
MPTLQTARLHERLARRLALEIVAGQWSQDEVVPSAEVLAADYGVSRTVARETLQALSSAGLISVRHGKRTVVAPMYEWRFLDDLVQSAVASGRIGGKVATDLLETRICLEIQAARWCAQRASDELLESINETAEDQLRLAKDPAPSMNELAAIDIRFHTLLVQGSDNNVVAQLASSLRRQLIPTWALDQLEPDELVKNAREHLSIAMALQSRDPDAVQKAVAKHFDWAADSMLKRSIPDLDHSEADRRIRLDR